MLKKIILITHISLFSVFITDAQKLNLINKYINVDALQSVLYNINTVFFQKEYTIYHCNELSDVENLMLQNNLIISLYKNSNWAYIYKLTNVSTLYEDINKIFINNFEDQDDSSIIEGLDVLYLNGGTIESMLHLILYAKKLLKNKNNKKLKLFLGIKFNRPSIDGVETVGNIIGLIEKNLERKLNEEDISWIKKNSTNEEGFAEIIMYFFKDDLDIEIFYHNTNIHIKDLSEFFNFILADKKEKINIGVLGLGFFTFQMAIKIELDQLLEKIKYNNYNLFFLGMKNDLIMNEKKLNQKLKLALYLIGMILDVNKYF